MSMAMYAYRKPRTNFELLGTGVFCVVVALFTLGIRRYYQLYSGT